MRILVSNDDSVHAPGIHVLAEELRKIGDVWIVAPLDEKSTTGHSLTIHKPLRLIQAKQYGAKVYGVSGSPADCVYVGIKQVLGGRKPDLVVSGINRGANLGQDVYYSGTVSAAREASILGIPSIAVSLAVNFKGPLNEEKLNYPSAAKWVSKIIKQVGHKNIPKHTLLNVNVPDLPLKKIKGVQAAQQGFRHYSGSVLKRMDHRGKAYFWVGGEYKGFQKDLGSDCLLVDNGYVAITPLQLDCTHFSYLENLANQLK